MPIFLFLKVNVYIVETLLLKTGIIMLVFARLKLIRGHDIESAGFDSANSKNEVEFSYHVLELTQFTAKKGHNLQYTLF